MYDLLIKNARVADGLGNPLVTADVAVKDGRIAAIGEALDSAAENVDAKGLVLAPGIIDAHTHYDAQLTWDSRCTPSPALGVTTVVIGNCGFGIAPNRPEVRDVLMQNLSEVEGMSLDSLRAGIDWGFRSFPEYLDMLRDKGVYLNVAAFLCHSSLRGTVLGADASKRAATSDELERMKRILEEAMEAGAIGFASSNFENHNGYAGVPMPSRLADDKEFETLIGVLGEKGRGLFMITVGQRTTVETLAGYARRTGRPMVYAALFYNELLPDRSRDVLAACREAQTAGLPVFAQVSCQPLSMDFTLDNAYPMYGVDPWGKLPIADRGAIIGAFGDAGFRQAIRDSLSTPVGGRLFNGDWGRVEVSLSPTHRDYEGRSVADLAREAGVDPVTFFFDLAVEEDLATVFTAKLVNVVEDGVAELLRHPDSLVSLSDAGAHLTFMCDAGFGLYLLGHWVRDRRIMDLPQAIRELTSRPAEVYGIPDRGRIAAGAFADMILFDPDQVGVGKPERVNDLPGGASRLTRRPLGLRGVWVNGVKIHDGIDYVDHARPPGRVLDSFSA